MKRNRMGLLLLALIMLISSLALSGCGKEATSAESPEVSYPADSAQPSSAAEGDTLASLYPNTDLSEPVTINLWELGNAPKDIEMVVPEINKILEKEVNTTLKINFIAWGDLATKYSLVLAGGEDVDLVHTAPWNYYYTEAAKGAFMEITDDFITKYMPQTKKSQVPESWEGTRINGKIYGVPMNSVESEAKFVAIREDLRQKYDIPTPTDWASYENFLVTIAEKETPESGIFGIAASAGNGELRRLWMQQYEMYDGQNAQIGPFAYLYNGGAIPKDDEFFVYWDSQYMRDFVKRMKYLADKGCWSQDALSGTVSDDDSFKNGQGASVAWNRTLYQIGLECEKNIPGAVAAFCDLTSDKIVTAENYNNNMEAIASASKNPERAAMVLDLLKNYTPLYRLIYGGIEGTHYIKVDDEHFKKGSSYDNFPMAAFAWELRRKDLQSIDTDPREVALQATFEPRMVMPPTNGFAFDEQPVKNEMAAVQAVIDEYTPMLELGLVDDPDATIDEMIDRMEQSGLDTVKTEFLKQYNDWLETKN